MPQKLAHPALISPYKGERDRGSFCGILVFEKLLMEPGKRRLLFVKCL